MIPADGRWGGSGIGDLPDFGRRCAIVAHEDAQARAFLKEALWRAGYAAEVCDDAGAYLESGNGRPCSFLVMKDGARGMETLRWIRSRGIQIPVILLSQAAPDPETRPDSDMGTVGRLAAPFTLTMLRTAIAQVCHDESGEQRMTSSRT